MAFELIPHPGDRGEPDVKVGRVGGSAVGEGRRLVHHGVQVLAWGSLACPRCSLPISPTPRVRPRAPLNCAYCDHVGAAIDFLREEVVDTPGNDAKLVARIT